MGLADKQEAEFNQLQRGLFNQINIDHLTGVYFASVAEAMVSTIIESTQDIPDVTKIYDQANVTMRLGIGKLFRNLWEDSIDLGVKHQAEHIMYSNKPIKKLWDTLYAPKKYDSLFSGGDLTAHFDIQRAEKELDKLTKNIDKAEVAGIYDNLDDSGAIPGRYTPRERRNFLYSLREVSNMRRRVEASKVGFIQDTYMQNRFRVLSRDVADKFDDRTKKAVVKFIAKDTRFYSTLKANKLYARNAQIAIAAELEKAALEEINEGADLKRRRVDEPTRRKLYRRAESILRTETSFAYNVGKLIGYASPEDLQKEFIWRADWELRGKKTGYQICDFCKSMDKRIFTAEQLIAAGMRLDRSIGTYDGTAKTKTSFKNPALPSIPAHVNCQCYFARHITKKDYEAMIAAETAPLPAVEDMDSKILPAVATTAVVVGSLFLLSRSNVWQKLYKSVLGNPLKKIGLAEQVADGAAYVRSIADNDTTRNLVDDLLK
jgi:hypothetical protein